MPQEIIRFEHSYSPIASVESAINTTIDKFRGRHPEAEMSETQSTTGSAASIDTESADLTSIGIELEYPVAPEPEEVPAASAFRSHDLRGWFSEGEWLPDFGDNRGYVGSDHTGAEITSGILDLHSDEPERWYRGTIRASEEARHPFAATGYGSTYFGLHMHVSSLRDSPRAAIGAACDDEWARVFFCSSISETSLDPWRHYSSSSPGNPFRRDRRGESDHYEFRLPEPVLEDHFDLIMEFWRKVEADSPEDAIDFARELVHDRDERLTPVVQYNQLRDTMDDWPTEVCFTDEEGDPTDRSAAEWFHDLME